MKNLQNVGTPRMAFAKSTKTKRFQEQDDRTENASQFSQNHLDCRLIVSEVATVLNMSIDWVLRDVPQNPAVDPRVASAIDVPSCSACRSCTTRSRPTSTCTMPRIAMLDNPISRA